MAKADTQCNGGKGGGPLAAMMWYFNRNYLCIHYAIRDSMTNEGHFSVMGYNPPGLRKLGPDIEKDHDNFFKDFSNTIKLQNGFQRADDDWTGGFFLVLSLKRGLLGASNPFSCYPGHSGSTKLMGSLLVRIKPKLAFTETLGPFSSSLLAAASCRPGVHGDYCCGLLSYNQVNLVVRSRFKYSVLDSYNFEKTTNLNELLTVQWAREIAWVLEIL
uniref:Uncharacterized protein n=1 Tax=Oryza brachyantha TaxID=4533 RepID=J3LRQ6_ORYBR